MPTATGTELSVTVDDIAPRTTVDRRYGETTVLPVALNEIEAPAIAKHALVAAQPVCRTDLVEVDGNPLGVSVDPATIDQLLSGVGVEVHTCPSSPLHLAAGTHRMSTAAGLTTGLDIDQILLRSGEPAPADSQPTVTTGRTRTTRTTTVTGCPDGCWLILGEGYNDGWKATAGSIDLGAPRQISGGFNGWRLPGSTTPVTVTMTWTPQRTMWIGMILTVLAVLACAVLVWRDRAVAQMRTPSAPVPYWPVERVGRRRAVTAAIVLVVLAVITISPTYAVLAAGVAVAIVILRRPQVAGGAAISLVVAVAALILRRQIRYRLVANPSWPAAFDDLHRLGLLVVVLLLAATIVDDRPEVPPECPADEPEQLA